ncbi:MAG: SUF system NifU family Fe-S cluster assembly protein [Bacillota bacterium]|nr:SUF system NifU family Fe-S cluster assembly protein [Bacillota bacterium]
MTNKTFYNEILTEHNIRPLHKKTLEGANLKLEGINPSCGDEITVSLKVNDQGLVEDGAFEGSGCAISQASTDMMLDLIIGRSKEQALELADIFLRMIQKQASPEEMEMLEEASILEDVSNMPARVKCAVLGWRTAEQMLKDHE